MITNLINYRLVSLGERIFSYNSEESLHKNIFVKKVPVWKRTFDIIGSIIGIILFFPIFVVTGFYIKIVSPGPIFFRQKRVGLGGYNFDLLKFRTMIPEADPKYHKKYLTQLIQSSQDNSIIGLPMKKLLKDQRVIKLGNFLRASAIDELPQLLNVLRGQMSLIGPRPAIPYEVEQYKIWFRSRFDVLPGMTGLWQVNGKNKLGYNEMIRLDIQYVQNQTIILDLKILLKTPYVIYLQIKELSLLDKLLSPFKKQSVC